MNKYLRASLLNLKYVLQMRELTNWVLDIDKVIELINELEEQNKRLEAECTKVSLFYKRLEAENKRLEAENLSYEKREQAYIAQIEAQEINDE